MKCMISLISFALALSACNNQIIQQEKEDCGVTVSYIPNISLQLTTTYEYNNKIILMSLPNDEHFLNISCNDQYTGQSEMAPGVHCAYSQQLNLNQDLIQFNLSSLPMLGNETKSIRFLIVDNVDEMNHPIEKNIQVSSESEIKKINIGNCESRLVQIQYSGELK